MRACIHIGPILSNVQRPKNGPATRKRPAIQKWSKYNWPIKYTTKTNSFQLSHTFHTSFATILQNIKQNSQQLSKMLHVRKTGQERFRKLQETLCRRVPGPIILYHSNPSIFLNLVLSCFICFFSVFIMANISLMWLFSYLFSMISFTSCWNISFVSFVSEFLLLAGDLMTFMLFCVFRSLLRFESSVM